VVLCDAEIQTRSARLEGFFFSSFFFFRSGESLGTWATGGGEMSVWYGMVKDRGMAGFDLRNGGIVTY